MSVSDPVHIPGQRRMGAGAIIFLSTLLSTVASVAIVYALLQAKLLVVASPPQPAAAPAATEARVPELVGMPEAAADELLAARSLRLLVEKREPDARAAAGSVVSQTPLAGSRVSTGDAVSVVVSSGAPQKLVPQLAGQTLEAATQALEAAGFKLGPVSESEEGEDGTVTAAVPPAGTPLAPGSLVALSVARNKVEVPALRDMPIKKAREKLEALGLEVGDVSEIFDRRRRGLVVLTQDPDPGTRVALGSKVKLVINQGD